MTSVTVSETTYNVTVAETNNTVTVGATTGDINVSVNATDISTSIDHSGALGVEILKSLANNVLTARKIRTSGNDVSIAQNTDDIDITLSDTITVDLNGNLKATTTEISGHLVPATDDTHDLGSTTKRFRDLYLGPGSLYINNQKVLEDDSGTIKISTDSGQNLNVQAGGTITMLSSGATTTMQDATVNIGPSNNSGTTNIRGTLDVVTKIEMGDLDLTSGSIHQDASNGNLEIKTNGTGYIHVNTADFYVGAGNPASDEFVKIDENSISKIGGGSLTYTGSVVGNVTGTVSDISNHLLDEDDMSTDSNTKAPTQQSVKAFVTSQIQTKDNSDEITEGSTNLYFTDARARAAISENSTQLAYNSSTGVLTYTQGDTDTVSEGSSNQYFTTARARASISASGSLAYNSGTGALTYTQGNTDTVSEGSSNLYYTNARADARITNAIKDEDNMASNSATHVPSQQSVKAYVDSQILTKDNSDEITEGSSNLYFTDARARGAISENSTQLAYNSSTGVLTYTQGNTDTVSEGSSNLYHTTARAISAVEGESTLALGGAVTVTGLLTANDTLKVDDGFTQTSFNPYGAGANMPTTVAGIGQDEGWAALHIRSRGEHDFGIGSQYNLVPRALMTLSAGRKDGSSDDYLNNNDTFGAVLYNPYSTYRTGTEWLTPSASIYGVATENHSASGMGTSLQFSTTENQNKAGAADLAHTNGIITFQGTTITSSGTLKIDDDLQVTGDIGNNGSAVDFDDNIKVTGNVSSKTTTIGDFDSSGSPAYAMSGIQLDAGDTAWPSVVFKEYAGTDGGGLKPVNLFTNPGFETEVFGGTPASPAALGDGKRILAINGNAANGATLPGLANIRILGQTKGAQSGSNRGSELIFQTTPENSTNISATLNIKEGNVIRIGNDSYDSGHGIIGASGGDLKLGDRLDTNGNNILNSSGDVTVDDNLQVNDNLTVSDNLTVNGNTVLGNANTDTATATAKLIAQNGFNNTVLTVDVANALIGLSVVQAGDQAMISNGNAGSACMAFSPDGSSWKKMHSPGDNISAS